MLPGRDGLEILRTVRQRGLATPVIILSARDTVEDRIRGLDQGADDYLVKPFAFEELLARIRALLRRGRVQDVLRFVVADLEADRVTRRVTRGDRVAAYMPNMPHTVIAMLATASLGAIFTSASPDFGVQGVLDRFGQTEPKVLIACDGYYYGGKTVDVLDKLGEIVGQLPSVQRVVVVPYVHHDHDLSHVPHARMYADFIAPFHFVEGRSVPADELRGVARAARGAAAQCGRRRLMPLTIAATRLVRSTMLISSAAATCTPARPSIEWNRWSCVIRTSACWRRQSS